ncbi:GntR family transcriptional regulator [Breznakiella homolactica]|uniref:GntR family transcriptional regulator n=1 Tax=Breznakiella homolactica TaxID=2798577 RepID=A0A7T7XL02_9SPIR|nr:GntR family transcriptional regulator [Breznakiella homolactica]QQO08128.1 GntR family transcriptional regulator [Breznakiella homolactica]
MKSSILTQKAYGLIKEKILTLEIKPHQRIMENELAEDFEISRTPVREAIKQLMSEGFIINIPHQGYYCVALSLKEIDEIIDVRLSLETLALKTSLKNGFTPEQLGILQNLTNEFENSVVSGDSSKINLLDSEFHRTLYEFSGNQMLIKFLRDIEDYMTIVRNMELYGLGVAKGNLALPDHKNILKALQENDEEEAIRSLEHNINQMRINISSSRL